MIRSLATLSAVLLATSASAAGFEARVLAAAGRAGKGTWRRSWLRQRA